MSIEEIQKKLRFLSTCTGNPAFVRLGLAEIIQELDKYADIIHEWEHIEKAHQIPDEDES